MNGKKHYDKSKTKERVKMNVTLYEKKFESFLEMIEEFKTLHPEFINILQHETNDPSILIDDVVHYITFNIPNVITRNNLPASLNITANRVALKTSKFFSVEWSFKYDKEGNISELSSTIGTFTKEKNNEELDAMINILKDSWTIKELNK